MANPEKALKEVPSGPISALSEEEKNVYNGEEIYKRYAGKVGTEEDGIKGIDEGPNLIDAILPNIAKFVRLSFHDCLQDDSENSGCNGCLNFDGMGVEGEGLKHTRCHLDQSCAVSSLPKETNNNNLFWVARVLEGVYDDSNLPIPPLNLNNNVANTVLGKSLRENGKSRGDLWAFAGLVAIEIGAQFHNNICDPQGEGLCAFQVDSETPCGYTMPHLVFKYGRRDCTDRCSGVDAVYGFCTNAKETHPDPQGNGLKVTSFFQEQFDLTKRETIALMGAHTFGHPNEQISGFRHYKWEHNGADLMDNEYYKIMVNPNMYRMNLKWENRKNAFDSPGECNLGYSTFLGDEHGNPYPADWVARSQWLTNDGGPWNWIPFGGQCDDRVCQMMRDTSPKEEWVMHKLFKCEV